jgi:DNA polymerase-3 subunit delta'
MPNLPLQTQVISWLGKMAASGRIPQALLFSGIEGIGKQETGLYFARMINCEAPGETVPCGRCLSCRKMEKGNHPDLLVLSPQGVFIRVEQIREMLRALSYPPLEAKYRVILIVQAQNLQLVAAQSLLKTLEEPPPGNIFILTAGDPQDLLPTIVSRCQVVRFSPLPLKTVEQTLLTREMEDPVEVRLLAAVSGGSIERARTLARAGMRTLRDEWLEKTGGLHYKNLDQPVYLAALWGKDKKRLSLLLILMALWYRDLSWIRQGVDEGFLVNQDRVRELKVQARRLTQEEILSFWEDVMEAQRDLEANLHPQLILEVLLLKTAACGVRTQVHE